MIQNILLLSIIPLNSAEKKDCSDLKKFSKAFIACKANNIKVIDMQLPKNDTIFYDDMHFNEEGAEVVAEKIYQFLII